jgi:hypothetical protein
MKTTYSDLCRVIEIIKTIPDLCYTGEVWTECFDDPGVFYTETPKGNYLHFQFFGFNESFNFEKEKVVKFLDPVKKEDTEHYRKKTERNQKRIEELQSEINRLQEIIETLKKEI